MGRIALVELSPLLARDKVETRRTVPAAHRRRRIAPDERDTARAELGARGRARGGTADRKRLGPYEHQEQLLPVLETVAPERVKILAVDAVKRIVEIYAE